MVGWTRATPGRSGVGTHRGGLDMTGQVVYGIIVRSLSDDGLRGVQARLPYLRSLGVTTIWLSPIFEHAMHDFGYAVTDFMKIDPEHGTDTDLRILVAAAHRLGLRILVDFAPNHTSDHHPLYRDVQARGSESPYAGYYATGRDGGHTHYFSWDNLINLNYADPGVRQLVVGAMRYWLTEYDVDGYRMDAAWGIRQRTPSFWPACVQSLRAAKPDVFLLAEASALDPYYRQAGFDSAYDWTNHLGVGAWSHSFDDDPARLTRDLTYHLARSAHDSTVFRFLNNNDTGPRFISVHGAERYRLAAALLLTLPGTPCLFMGDEVGLEFSPYRQHGVVSWVENPDLWEFHRRLIELRTLHQMHSGPLAVLGNDRPEQCVSYGQPGRAGRRLVCVLNAGPASDVTTHTGSTVASRALDLWSGETTSVVDGDVRVRLDENAFAILQLDR
jgi:cyclomaltodextrinase / maltogenic alpha-amylase / neopullulanase